MQISRWKLAAIAVATATIGWSLGYGIAIRQALGPVQIASEAAKSYRDFSRDARASEAARDLEALKALRAAEADKTAGILEEQLQDHLDSLSLDPRPSERVAGAIGEIEAYRERYPWVPPSSANQPSGNLFADARILPVYQESEMVGFQVSRIAAGSAWAKMGLRERDVVTEVGGLSMSSPRNTARALAKLEGSQRFEVHRIDERRVLLKAVPE